jgi:hypothetical protein
MFYECTQQTLVNVKNRNEGTKEIRTISKTKGMIKKMAQVEGGEGGRTGSQKILNVSSSINL